MKMHLSISCYIDDFTWELWAKGLGITKYHCYTSAKSATRAAKRVAKKLGIVITEERK